MPIEPPDPGRIAAVFREELSQIRDLIAAQPDEPRYPKAYEAVKLAIDLLDPSGKA